MFCLRRGGSRADATSKMEHLVTIVNGCKPLFVITKRSILDVAAVLDPPVTYINEKKYLPDKTSFGTQSSIECLPPIFVETHLDKKADITFYVKVF